MYKFEEHPILCEHGFCEKSPLAKNKLVSCHSLFNFIVSNQNEE